MAVITPGGRYGHSTAIPARSGKNKNRDAEANFSSSRRLMIERGQARAINPCRFIRAAPLRETNMAKIANRVFDIETASTLAFVLLSALALVSA